MKNYMKHVINKTRLLKILYFAMLCNYDVVKIIENSNNIAMFQIIILTTHAI